MLILLPTGRNTEPSTKKSIFAQKRFITRLILGFLFGSFAWTIAGLCSWQCCVRPISILLQCVCLDKLIASLLSLNKCQIMITYSVHLHLLGINLRAHNQHCMITKEWFTGTMLLLFSDSRMTPSFIGLNYKAHDAACRPGTKQLVAQRSQAKVLDFSVECRCSRPYYPVRLPASLHCNPEMPRKLSRGPTSLGQQ